MPGIKINSCIRMAYEFLCFSFGIFISGSIFFRRRSLLSLLGSAALCAKASLCSWCVSYQRKKKRQREKFLRIKFHRKQTLFFETSQISLLKVSVQNETKQHGVRTASYVTHLDFQVVLEAVHTCSCVTGRLTKINSGALEKLHSVGINLTRICDLVPRLKG